MFLKGKTADKLYDKFALPVFLMAFAAIVMVPAGYVYSQTPEGSAKVQQVVKTSKEATGTMLAMVQSKGKRI